MPNSVYLLQIITKYDLEDTPHLTGEVLKIIKRWCKPGMHAKRNIAFVIVTDESLDELGERLWEDMLRLKELGRIERFILNPAPQKVITDFGNIDPLMHWLGLGWVESRQRNQPQNVTDSQRRKFRHRRAVNNL